MVDIDSNTIASLFDEPTSHGESIQNTLQHPLVLTNDIVQVIDGTHQFFTFKVLMPYESDEFYNLILEINENGELFDTKLIGYLPDADWLGDTSQPFQGYMRIVNEPIGMEGLEDTWSRPSAYCATGYNVSWSCSYGNPHSPDDECEANSFEYTIEILWGPCLGDDGGGSGIPVGGDPSEGDGNPCSGCGGQGGNGGSSGTQVLYPQPFDEILECFPGVLQIDGASNLLNANKNLAGKVRDYIDSHGCNDETILFLISALEAIVDGGEVDFVNEVLYDSITQKCAKEIVKRVVENSSSLSQNILGYFNQDKNYIINYKSDNLQGNSLGATSPTSTCVSNICTINVALENDMLNQSTDMLIAKVALHETIHTALTYLFETGQFVNQGLDPNASTNPNYSNLVNAYIISLVTSNPDSYIGDANELQHEYMTVFVDDMVASLQVIGQNLGYQLNSPQLQQDYLTDLAWSGSLEDTYGFVYAYPDLTDQERVIAMGVAEFLNMQRPYPIYDNNGNHIGTGSVNPLSNQINNSNDPCY